MDNNGIVTHVLLDSEEGVFKWVVDGDNEVYEEKPIFLVKSMFEGENTENWINIIKAIKTVYEEDVWDKWVDVSTQNVCHPLVINKIESVDQGILINFIAVAGTLTLHDFVRFDNIDVYFKHTKAYASGCAELLKGLLEQRGFILGRTIQIAGRTVEYFYHDWDGEPNNENITLIESKIGDGYGYNAQDLNTEGHKGWWKTIEEEEDDEEW